MIQIICKNKEILTGVVPLINEYELKYNRVVGKLTISVYISEDYFLYSGFCGRIRSCWNEEEVSIKTK